MYVFTSLSARAGCDKRSILKVWIQSFPSPKTGCLNKAKEPSLSYGLPIAARRIIGLIPFLRVFVYNKCNQVCPGFELMSPCPISYDDSHYPTVTSARYGVRFWLIISILYTLSQWGLKCQRYTLTLRNTFDAFEDRQYSMVDGKWSEQKGEYCES